MTANENQDAPEKRARLELPDGSEHNFGTMERMAKQAHTFRIRSVGEAPLVLQVNHTSCKCSVGSIRGDKFQPGETADIEVEWTGQASAGQPEFRQVVEVSTNDPERETLELVISGRVTETIRVLPEELVMGRVPADAGTQAEFRLFAFRHPQIEILETAWEDLETASFFELRFDPLPAEEYEKEKRGDVRLRGSSNRQIRVASWADKSDNSNPCSGG